MEEKQELRELLERLDRSSQRQTKYAKWQCVLTGVAAVCCCGLVVLVGSLMPQVRELTGQMEVVLANLEVVTNQLAAMDLAGMVDNVDTLVSTSQAAVEQAVDKLNAIDFDILNRAIEDLADVVEPLAKFFNVFN